VPCLTCSSRRVDLYGYDGQDRAVPTVNPGTFLGAIESFHNDGPWDPPENFRKLNFVLRYSQGSPTDGCSLMLNGYSGAWTGDVINDFGFQVRNDYIMDIALNHTHQRNVYEQLTDDRVIETSVSEYFENRIQFCDWFRTVAGVRGDFLPRP
jgi:hypothetical protein